ncbi:hypothetical protein OIU78_017283 [Salix suchowensis]|nr:hypothetical protein OIU78_017283 [Salix suchowensis]
MPQDSLLTFCALYDAVAIAWQGCQIEFHPCCCRSHQSLILLLKNEWKGRSLFMILFF